MTLKMSFGIFSSDRPLKDDVEHGLLNKDGKETGSDCFYCGLLHTRRDDHVLQHCRTLELKFKNDSDGFVSSQPFRKGFLCGA